MFMRQSFHTLANLNKTLMEILIWWKNLNEVIEMVTEFERYQEAENDDKAWKPWINWKWWQSDGFTSVKNDTGTWRQSGIILCVCPANGRRRYIVTSSLIGWAHTQNDPWQYLSWKWWWDLADIERFHEAENNDSVWRISWWWYPMTGHFTLLVPWTGVPVWWMVCLFSVQRLAGEIICPVFHGISL